MAGWAPRTEASSSSARWDTHSRSTPSPAPHSRATAASVSSARPSTGGAIGRWSAKPSSVDARRRSGASSASRSCSTPCRCIEVATSTTTRCLRPKSRPAAPSACSASTEPTVRITRGSGSGASSRRRPRRWRGATGSARAGRRRTRAAHLLELTGRADGEHRGAQPVGLRGQPRVAEAVPVPLRHRDEAGHGRPSPRRGARARLGPSTCRVKVIDAPGRR